MEFLFQATTEYFCAGFITNSKGNIIEAAPIIRWSIGKHLLDLLEFVQKKNGNIKGIYMNYKIFLSKEEFDRFMEILNDPPVVKERLLKLFEEKSVIELNLLENKK